jgi:uncharacterized protein YwqG
MTTAPELVRHLLLLVGLMGLPAIGLGGVIGMIILLDGMRRRGPPAAAGRTTIESADAVRVIRRMRRNKTVTLSMTPTDGKSFSQLGGQPSLPPEMAWPRGPEGALRFLCQLDLSEIRMQGGPEWLPQTGFLYAFHDERYGCHDQIQLFHVAQAAPVERRAPTEASAWEYAERPIRFEAKPSYPSLEWLCEDVRSLDATDYEFDAIADFESGEDDGPRHRIGGYPDEIQDEPMALNCEYAARGLALGGDGTVDPAIRRASQDWRMILQIDSDPDLGANWGDGGRLYVFIKPADARQGFFEKTVTLSQTY